MQSIIRVFNTLHRVRRLGELGKYTPEPQLPHRACLHALAIPKRPGQGRRPKSLGESSIRPIDYRNPSRSWFGAPKPPGFGAH